MIVYSHDGGYGNESVEEAREIVDRYLPVGSRDKVVLLSLLHDYWVLLNVIDGKNCVFRHEDGSETRRLRLYG